MAFREWVQWFPLTCGFHLPQFQLPVVNRGLKILNEKFQNEAIHKQGEEIPGVWLRPPRTPISPRAASPPGCRSPASLRWEPFGPSDPRSPHCTSLCLSDPCFTYQCPQSARVVMLGIRICWEALRCFLLSEKAKVLQHHQASYHLTSSQGRWWVQYNKIFWERKTTLYICHCA